MREDSVNGSQCDNCRVFQPSPTIGWLTLSRRTREPSAAVLFSGPGSETAGTFCSVKCVAEYAYTLAATTEVQ